MLKKVTKFFAIVFCKLYEWNVGYAVTKKIAALSAIYFLSLFILINLISIWWGILFSFGLFSVLFSPSSSALIVLVLLFIIVMILNENFIKKGKYIKLTKQIARENPHIFKLNRKWLTLFYLLFSILIFIACTFVSIKKSNG